MLTLPDTTHSKQLARGGVGEICCTRLGADPKRHFLTMIKQRPFPARTSCSKPSSLGLAHLHRHPRAAGVPTPTTTKCNAAPAPKQSTSTVQEQEQEPAYKYSDGVNQFLGNFLPSSKAARDELAVDWDAPKLTGLSIQELAKLVEQGLSRTQWFVTGQVDARLFADNFAFKDESVATTGIKAYATGVRKLFDQETSKAELISVTANVSSNKLVVVWRLEGRVNLPFKPKIKPYVVTTTFGLDPQGLICCQLDEFSVPGWDLLLSTLLGEGFGAKPAGPIEELRAAAAAGRQLQ